MRLLLSEIRLGLAKSQCNPISGFNRRLSGLEFPQKKKVIAYCLLTLFFQRAAKLFFLMIKRGRLIKR